MSQNFKKALATTFAFLVSPVVPIALPTVGLIVFQSQETLGFLYAVSFMYFLLIALPAYLTLFFLRGSVEFWSAAAVGLFGGCK